MLPKKILIPFVVVLSLGLQACLLEQVLATAAEWLPHEHQRSEAQNHELPAPAHSHDQDSHESLYCCDNSLSQFFGSKGSADFGSAYFFSSFMVAIESAILDYSRKTFYSYNSEPPLTLRARDKYALSCLLHAPPLA